MASLCSLTFAPWNLSACDSAPLRSRSLICAQKPKKEKKDKKDKKEKKEAKKAKARLGHRVVCRLTGRRDFGVPRDNLRHGAMIRKTFVRFPKRQSDRHAK